MFGGGGVGGLVGYGGEVAEGGREREMEREEEAVSARSTESQATVLVVETMLAVGQAEPERTSLPTSLPASQKSRKRHKTTGLERRIVASMLTTCIALVLGQSGKRNM